MVATTAGEAGTGSRRFYVGMALAFVVIAFGGFIPTYWAKLASGTFTGHPILHIHGMLFFGWTLLFLAQTTLAAQGRLRDHRAWGIAGVALATAMGFTVVLAAINSIKVAEAMGMGDAARRFTVVSLGALALFGTFFTLAIVNNTRAELHKRLMILAMIPLMQAATARIFQTLANGPPGPPPVFVAIPPGILVDLLVVVAMVYDWRTRGRPHPVYWIGLAALLAEQLLGPPISQTGAWMSFARGVESLAG